MKLTEQLLSEMGAGDKSFTIALGFGGYFKGVKRVEEYSPEQIVITAFSKRIKISGKNLAIGEYFQEDIFISGDIKFVEVE